MIGKNLKKFRIQRSYSQIQLANMVGISKMAISNYENDKRDPSEEVLLKLSDALNVPVLDFINVNDQSLIFEHKQFRAKSKLNNIEKEYLYSYIEDYCNSLFDTMDISGIKIKPFKFKLHSFDSNNLINEIVKIKKALDVNCLRPILNLSSALENAGIIMIFGDFNKNISGCNGLVNDIPYIAINKNFSQERQRFSICHELYHLLFDEENDEELANVFAGNFLLPTAALSFFYGDKSQSFKLGVDYISKKFGVSRSCVAKRALDEKIITYSAYKYYMIELSKTFGSRNAEPTQIDYEMECSNLLSDNVISCLSKGEINITKAMELMFVKNVNEFRLKVGI